jgi:antitoxin FitA
VPQLIVRKIEHEIVRALKMRAARKNRSAEAEHREILREALLPAQQVRDFRELLLSIPAGAANIVVRRSSSGRRRVKLG